MKHIYFLLLLIGFTNASSRILLQPRSGTPPGESPRARSPPPGILKKHGSSHRTGHSVRFSESPPHIFQGKSRSPSPERSPSPDLDKSNFAQAKGFTTNGQLKTNNHPTQNKRASNRHSLPDASITGDVSASVAAKAKEGGFAEASAWGRKEVSAVVKTGSNSEGCVECKFPELEKTVHSIGSKETKTFRFQNPNPEAGRARITAQTLGKGKVLATGWNKESGL